MEDKFLNIKNYYKDLVIKILSGNASIEEKEILKEWLMQSDENMIYFNQIKHTWQLSSFSQKSYRFDTESAWKKTNPRIKTGAKGKTVYGLSFTFITRIAAFWILAFLLGGLAMYFVFQKTQMVPETTSNSINEIIAPLGSKSKVYLPDGTLVWLNAGSKLCYSQAYNTRHRDVYLEGEAYFKVKKNPNKPFVVKTTEINVTAYGTSFNVKAYPDESTITTTLVEGIVEIEGTNKTLKKFEISLKPNQTLTYIKKLSLSNISANSTANTKYKNLSPAVQKSKEAVPVVIDKNIKTSLYTSWKDDKWIIEREPLNDLVVKLQRRFNVTFIYKSEALKKYKISGIIQKETLEQVLDILKLTAPLKYTIKKGVVTLEMDPSRTENYKKVMN